MTITEAIDELRDLVQCRRHEAYKGRALHDPDCHCDSAEAVEVVARAFASGELIPLADHKLAVALVVERAAGIRNAGKYFSEWDYCYPGNISLERACSQIADAISAFDALIPNDALAELQALRADRDHWHEGWKQAMGEFDAKCKEANAQRDRAEAAEAELATFRTAEKKLSDAYLRLRAKLGAWDTAHAGADRFEVTEKALDGLIAELAATQARLARVVEALSWYGEQARLCRLIHSEGDLGRQALGQDGGKLARAALEGAKP